MACAMPGPLASPRSDSSRRQSCSSGRSARSGAARGAAGAARGPRDRAARAGVAVELFQRLVAQSALGRVVDPLERQIVAGLRDQPQIGERIADFRAFVEPEAADDLVRQADRDEAVFEFAGLVLRTNQDCDLAEQCAFAFEPFDLFADPARFLGRVPHPDHADLVAAIALGPQRLAQPLAVGVDLPQPCLQLDCRHSLGRLAPGRHHWQDELPVRRREAPPLRPPAHLQHGIDRSVGVEVKRRRQFAQQQFHEGPIQAPAERRDTEAGNSDPSRASHGSCRC